MKTKIDWYKEVLELEPHSKLFFPLARLYVAEERYEEALEALSAGLRQHPEFLEARLLLLEVLNALGHAGDLSDQAKVLAGTISGYDTFWQAWAHLLTLEQGGKDTALAVNFLAARFRGKPVSWTDIIERGIRSLLFDGLESTPAPAESATEHAVQTIPGKLNDVRPADAAPAEKEQAQEDAGTAEALLDDLMEADVEQLHAVSGTVSSALDKMDEGPQNFAFTSLSSDAAGTADNDSEATAADWDTADDEEEEEDEPFSLRTKTMADLLAEQGDFEGALDIYRELLAVTPAGDGHDALSGLIKEMSTKIREKKGLLPGQSGKRKPVAKAEKPESGGLSGKKKLIDTLELLAQRLEARGTG